MKITIFGPGCPNCKTLAENAKKAVDELELEVAIEKVEDVNQMAEAGVFTTPGLAVNGEVKVSGRLAGVKEIKEFLK